MSTKINHRLFFVGRGVDRLTGPTRCRRIGWTATVNTGCPRWAVRVSCCPMSTPAKKKRKTMQATLGAGRKGHQLPSRVDSTLWKLLQAEAQRDRRNVSQTCILLLEEALRARGRQVDSGRPDADD